MLQTLPPWTCLLSRPLVSICSMPSLSCGGPAAASLSCRRQPNNCCGESPWRLATAQTESPLASISATIRTLSSLLHFRPRPAPVKTSSRRAGFVIALSTVSFLSLGSKPNRRLANQDIIRKAAAERRLPSMQRQGARSRRAMGPSSLLSARPPETLVRQSKFGFATMAQVYRPK
jgi:hypothetical protein